MDRNKSKIKIAIIIFMGFTMIIIPLRSKAYWTSGITKQQLNTSSVVKVGYWNQNFLWNSSTTYSIGERVVYNGTIYEARKESTNVKPGESPGWKSKWRVIS